MLAKLEPYLAHLILRHLLGGASAPLTERTMAAKLNAVNAARPAHKLACNFYEMKVKNDCSRGTRE